MNTPAPIEIFKPGRHTAMSGAVLEFSESDLQAMVDAYDPAVYDAPICVGHPKLNAPAYGWIGGLSFADGGVVLAAPRDVDPEFADMVNRKLFKKVSASLFAPDSPSNPKPGTYYLRHVGLLGAMPPAVKGLKEASFAEGDEGIVEFSYGDRAAASLFGRLRDFLIEKFGLETADSVTPAWEIDSIKEAAIRDEIEDRAEHGGLAPAFSEPTPKGDEMSAEDKARLAALEEENKQLKAEREAQRLAGLHATNVSFAEGLIAEGKLLPGNKATAVATLNLLAQRDEPFEFGEGDDKIAVTLDSFKTLLSSFPKQVDFAEHAAGAGTDAAVDFAAPHGYSTDPAALELHAKALAHQAANPDTSYLDAVKAVAK